MKKSLKVFLACAFGAGIGSLTALQINGIFWWIGLLVGGLFGYLTYEFKKVPQVLSRAWNVIVGWKPNWQFIFSVCIGVIHLVALLVGLGILVRQAGKYGGVVLILFCSGFGFIICFGLVFLEKRIIHVVPQIPKFLKEMFITLISVLKTLAKFIATVFIMIHSEIRLLCGIDAMIGAVIGYFAGNAIIGAISGGAFGTINYLFVSNVFLRKQILKYRVLKAKTT